MSRARNAVIIIILCIIGAYSVRKGPQLGLSVPPVDDVKDAVAGNANRGRRGSPKLTLASGTGEDLRDAVAGHAVGTPNNSNTVDSVPPPPRGSGFGGFGNQPNNPGQNFVPPPPGLSPSGPTTQDQTSGDNPGGDETGGPCNEGNGAGEGEGCVNGNREHDKH